MAIIGIALISGPDQSEAAYEAVETCLEGSQNSEVAVRVVVACGTRLWVVVSIEVHMVP